MPQPPDAPIQQRLRLVRRRIAAGVLATFVAAWLAVAALGKGGSSSTAATSGSSAVGNSSHSADGASSPPSDDGSGDDSSGGGFDSGPSQSQGQSSNQGGPVTTGQS
jgi:hypothetical protein